MLAPSCKQGRITCGQEPRGPLDGGPLVRAIARREHGRSSAVPVVCLTATSSRDKRRGRVDDHLVQRPLRVIRAARRKWPLRRKDPPLHGLPDPDRHETETCTAGHHGLALFHVRRC